MGKQLIAGIDEAGRGPLAGPVVAAAVILLPGIAIKGVKDSKLLSEQQREKLFPIIKASSISIGIGIVGQQVIDKINILQATWLAMRQAVENLSLRPEYLLVDGRPAKLGLDIPQEFIVRGDVKVSVISAASIIAKVTRDRLMSRLHEQFPGYGFDRHKGYGTRMHYQRLMELGPCPAHRQSFCLGVPAAQEKE